MLTEELEQRIERALTKAFRFGQIDGDHHRVWVVDQMVQALCGSDEAYLKWVRDYEEDGEYTWDTGVAP